MQVNWSEIGKSKSGDGLLKQQSENNHLPNDSKHYIALVEGRREWAESEEEGAPVNATGSSSFERMQLFDPL